MEFSESLLTSFFMMMIVFAALCGLYGILEGFSRLFANTPRNKPAKGSPSKS